MCNIDQSKLLDLLNATERVRPLPEATPEERAWYRGTVHGIKLALQQIVHG